MSDMDEFAMWLGYVGIIAAGCLLCALLIQVALDSLWKRAVATYKMAELQAALWAWRKGKKNEGEES